MKLRITHIILISLLNEHTFERRPIGAKLSSTKMELFNDSFLIAG
jgi:hypothetical protein